MHVWFAVRNDKELLSVQAIANQFLKCVLIPHERSPYSAPVIPSPATERPAGIARRPVQRFHFVTVLNLRPSRTICG